VTGLHRIDLALGPKIGSGAQGQLFRVEDVRVPDRSSLPDTLVFKEFHASTKVSGAGLEALARFRAELDEHDREVIDAMTVWPCAVVTDGSNRPCGYVMRSIPSEYFQHIETTGGAEHIPREIQQLFVPEAIARKNFGETANGVERLALAREMAFILGFLHKRDLVYGDLSYKNAVFRLRPHPGVIIMDCDAIRKVGETAGVAQLHSPGWKPPEGGPQTKGTDRYKLGLFVLRCVTPGVNAQNRDPAKAVGHLDAEGLSLLRRALDDDPDRRTTGKQWVQYFNARIAAAGGIRRRTGRPVEPKRPAVRRALARSWRDVPAPAVIGSGPRHAYVLTAGGGVQRAPVQSLPPSMPPLVTTSSRPMRGWPFTLGTSSFTNPQPPTVSSAAWVVAVIVFVVFGFVAASVVFGIIANSTPGVPGTPTKGNGAIVSSVTTEASGGLIVTSQANAAKQAVDGATKFLNAIDQRVVGVARRTDSTTLVDFAPADPDRSSGHAVWPLRSVLVTNDGSYVEQPQATLTADALPGLTGNWAVGLDVALRNATAIDFAYRCNPKGATPACVWKVGSQYFGVDGRPLPGLPWTS
jgi:hypothetical protein